MFCIYVLLVVPKAPPLIFSYPTRKDDGDSIEIIFKVRILISHPIYVDGM